MVVGKAGTLAGGDLGVARAARRSAPGMLGTMAPCRARGSIELADGTCISGLLPGALGTASTEEHRLRDNLARQLEGIIEAPLAYRSRADVLTRDAVFEVKARHLWRRGARQAVIYSGLCGKRPGLALFGPIPRDAMLKLRLDLSRGKILGLRASGSVALWWWTGSQWKPIIADTDCSDMPEGAGFACCQFCGKAVAWLSTVGQDPECLDYDGKVTGTIHQCEGHCDATHASLRDDCVYCASKRLTSLTRS